MRFLAANRSKFSVFEFSANVMRSIAVVRQVDGQLCRHPRQSKIGCTHQFQNRGSHELQEGDESGHRIAWKPEHRAFIQLTEKKRFSRFDRHAPDRVSIRCLADVARPAVVNGRAADKTVAGLPSRAGPLGTNRLQLQQTGWGGADARPFPHYSLPTFTVAPAAPGCPSSVVVGCFD